MKAGLIVAVATGLALSAVPADLFAQGASQRARAEQRERQAVSARERVEQQRRAEQQRRSAEASRIEQQRRPQADRRPAPARGVIGLPTRDQRQDARDRYDQRGPIYGQQQRNNGPAFCRNGTGHPVFGRSWCRDKGFGLGNDRNARDDRDYDIWRDIVFGQERDRRYDRSMNRSVLQDILGAVMLNRFESYGRQHGSGPLTGRWLEAGVLQLQLGSTPIARLIDSNRDGRVDNVLLRR